MKIMHSLLVAVGFFLLTGQRIFCMELQASEDVTTLFIGIDETGRVIVTAEKPNDNKPIAISIKASHAISFLGEHLLIDPTRSFVDQNNRITLDVSGGLISLMQGYALMMQKLQEKINQQQEKLYEQQKKIDMQQERINNQDKLLKDVQYYANNYCIQMASDYKAKLQDLREGLEMNAEQLKKVQIITQDKSVQDPDQYLDFSNLN